MIGYRISRRDLEELIEKHAKGWMARAAERTKHFQSVEMFDETSSIWSEVKPVYMALQGDSKCAFCERKLESIDFGKGEQAVEHFRPKGRVSRWKPEKTDLAVEITESPKGEGGYYLLAYDLFNYSAACNPCNSALKRDCFPVSGSYRLKGARPEKLLQEQPLLIYPIGDFDRDPEDLIKFNGISPYAAGRTQPELDRGLVTIEFFQLDSQRRSNLLLERARIIEVLFMALEDVNSPNTTADRKKRAKRIIQNAKSAKSLHANCARSFCDLYARDLTEATRMSELAAALVDSKS